LEKNELNEKEKKILEYVRKNPGVTKQGVVNHSSSSGLYSRKTVYKNLRTLTEDYKMIVVRKDKPNRSDPLFIHQQR
jgi:uncharacterized membrane protein